MAIPKEENKRIPFSQLIKMVTNLSVKKKKKVSVKPKDKPC